MKVDKKLVCRLLPVLLAAWLAAGCRPLSNPVQPGQAEAAETESEVTGSAETDLETEALDLPVPGLPEAFALSMVPEYSGSIWADIHEDIPFFDERQMEAARRMTSVLSQQDREAGAPDSLQREYSWQAYGDLDALGRCTGACALVGPETLPQEARGQIGMVRPTGWHTVKYDGIDGNYLYNRCHLIGFQLTGQDANEKNLITGTRSMNVEGMLPYEDSVLAYVKGTGNHVLYRVTPVFQKNNLLADGVLMEACSIEDPLVRFCAFCYNVQAGITIDYATGESSGPEFTGNDIPALTGSESAETESPAQSGDKGSETLQAGNNGAGAADGRSDIEEWKYIVNVNSLKFHLPGCQSVEKMSRKNIQGFNGTREELIEMGYTPCKNCRP